MTKGDLAQCASTSLATLVWTVPVRVLDVSRSGCRLEARRWLRVGISGQLTLQIGGRRRQDDIRIARCQLREGTGRRYFLGAELLPTRRLNDESIRLAFDRVASTHGSVSDYSVVTSEQSPPDRETEQEAKGVSRAPPCVGGKQ